jgi:hypothetical protein
MIAEFLAQYGVELGAVSIGTIGIISWRILGFFKKDKYILPFVNVAKTKANEIFGKENVTEFMAMAKSTKLEDVKTLGIEMMAKFKAVDSKLDLYFKVLLSLGALDTVPELKEEVEQIVEIT